MASTGTPRSTAGDDVKSQRVRDLLSSYYGATAGAEDAGSEVSESPGRSAASGFGPRVGSLDTVNFDADQFLAQLLRTSRLNTLYSKHIEMSNDIKGLDSDMQMLVYENYNKFITATDIIRSMKSNVDGMDSTMLDLKQKIETVADRSSKINSKLQSRRDHIDELNAVRMLLVKLQVVFDLPKRLQAAIKNGTLEVAVDTYAEAAPLLKKYGHKGAFRKVAAEADACAKHITRQLQQRVMAQDGEAAECIEMVRKLGAPVDSLQDEFLACMEKRMQAVLQEAAIVAAHLASPATPLTGVQGEAVANWTEQRKLPLTLARFCVQLDQRMLSALAQTGAQHAKFFEKSGRARLLKVAREALTSYLKLVQQVLTAAADREAAAAIARLTSAPSAAELRGQDSSAGAASSQGTPEASGNAAAQPASGQAGPWGAAALAEALHTINTDVGRVQSILPELSPRDRGAEVVEAVIRHHIGACFSALQEAVLRAVQQAEPLSGSKPQLLPAAEEASNVLCEGVRGVVAAMRSYPAQRSLLPWQDMFVDLVQGRLQNLFLSLLACFCQLAGIAPVPGSEAPHEASGLQPSRGPQLVLLLAHVSRAMQQQAVEAGMESLAQAFPGQGGGAGKDQPPAFVAGKVARVAGVASAELVKAFCAAHGRQLALAVRRSFASVNWLEAKEPRGPRPVCDLLLEQLAEAQAQAAQLTGEGLGQGHNSGLGQPPRQPTPVSPTFAAGAGDVLERNVARLFREQVTLFEEVELTQASIMAAIVRSGLKSLVECVRLVVLGRAGLQQLQVDMHYLRPRLRRFCAGKEVGTMQHLLDEVLAAAVERSVEPQLLDAPLLEKILAS